MREKGTNRSQFLRGQVDKYTWLDHGSSYLPSRAARRGPHVPVRLLHGVQRKRHAVWSTYASALKEWAGDYGITPMTVPERREHPAHLFYLLMPSHNDQRGFIECMAAQQIVELRSHYQPVA